MNSCSPTGINLPGGVSSYLKELRGADLRVAIAAAAAGTDGATVSALAKACGLSTRAVFNSVKVLASIALIQRDPKNGTWGVTPIAPQAPQALQAVVQSGEVPERPEDEAYRLVSEMMGSAASPEFLASIQSFTGRNWPDLLPVLRRLRAEGALFAANDPFMTALITDRVRGIGPNR